MSAAGLCAPALLTPLRMAAARLAPVLLALALLPWPAGEALAWSSQDRLFFEPVHQNAITRVLQKQLAADQLAHLVQAQAVADQDQKAQDSQFHAMAGVLSDQDLPNARRQQYIGMGESALRQRYQAAAEKRQAGDLLAAMDNLGAALHILTDATSPAHRCFQPWSYNEYVGDEIQHVFAERTTPDNSGPASDRARLDAAVQWGYDLYLGTQAMPEHFFDPVNGDLQIPARYGVQNVHANVAACK